MDTYDQSESSWRFPGWRVVVVASVGMVATLPGRTVGLGLITEPLLDDLQITRIRYSNLTLWATIFGAAFSPVCGRAIDRWGVRNCLAVVALLLAASTIAMSLTVSAANLLLFLILSRGFGQSSLSTASVTAVGKWFRSHLGIALGVFSALVALGFATAIPIVGQLINADNWRNIWLFVGVALLMVAALAFATIPSTTRKSETQKTDGDSVDWTRALRTATFWIFTLSVSLYYLVLSGLTLFCESVLAELGFDRSVYMLAMVAMMGAGLVGNFLVGWLSSRCAANRLLAASLLLLAIVLLGLPHLRSTSQVAGLFAVYGICGGAFAVLFFVGYGQAFGPRHLGKIQGVAQAFGVFASAIGPKLLAESEAASGTYWNTFRWLGAAASLFAVAAYCTPMFRAGPKEKVT
ncbi:MAG: MFS transporter, partial [Planctomycetota bacterium]